nr:hypothetical protein B7L52_04285 [Pectobacterium carotovorum]
MAQGYPSYFKLLVRWPPLLTPVTYLCKLLEIRAVAAFTQLELFRVSVLPMVRHGLCYVTRGSFIHQQSTCSCFTTVRRGKSGCDNKCGSTCTHK